MKFKIDIDWRDYQRSALQSIMSSPPASIHVIKSPRQCGKSTLLEALLLYTTIGNRNSCSIFVEPTNKQCKKVFREIRKAVESTPICVSANEATLDITFSNGSQILFISGESDISSLQGFVCKNGGMLIIDEAAFISDDVIYALTPTTDVHKSKIILASTPRYRANLFYEYYMSGLDNDSHIITHDWSGFTLLTPQRLEFYKKQLPEHLYRNYYLGEFTDFGSGVFGNITDCISSDYQVANIDCFMGIDWATGSGSDETSITIFNSKKQMIYLEHFNNLDETQTIDRIVEIVNMFNPKKIQVELNSIGRIFFGLLQKRVKNLNVSVKGFNTTNESKNKLVNKFQLAIQSKEVTILNDEKLIYQFNIFESKPTSTGKITYSAAKNGHDDLVLSTLIAYDCIENSSYKII